MSGATTLRTRALGISFGAFRAVSDVNLVLEPGARQALIGPNGAGKTTLINLLTGVFRPTIGSIHMGEHELTTLSADKRARLGLARTFQINTLFPSLTPLLSVVLAISERDGLGAVWWRPLARHKAVYDEAHALLGRLKLDALADVPVAELAYGKQRLLEIALAMAARPASSCSTSPPRASRRTKAASSSRPSPSCPRTSASCSSNTTWTSSSASLAASPCSWPARS